MAHRDMTFLDTGGFGGGDAKTIIDQINQFPTSRPRPSDGDQSPCLSGLRSLKDVLGIAAGAYGNGHIAVSAMCLNLTGKNFMIIIVIRDTR